ncbi:Hsp20/alpha crystallin family protein [Paenibacillus oceani]|uniref:Hsp20/alpha crystallin family protein n=1 Tax=Paenibacillus oceani TaxID=2772510 RepID=A0A927CE98_9BACL|nr:Hsp20/alpha crystallin family protein [Paenibacillus oceani]MBD2866474.1 Hsp20/alpha crystallin family protein [Paenibacillus oceani]
MALIPHDSFRNLEGWRRDLDRLFNDFPAFVKGDQQFGAHRIDIHETEHEVVATCDLPGLEKKEDVHIDVDGNMLTIAGTVNRTHEVKDEQMHRQERFYGRFHRSVTLPAAVNEEAIKASYRNGVLEIRMTKLQPPPKKKIDIEFH